MFEIGYWQDFFLSEVHPKTEVYVLLLFPLGVRFSVSGIEMTKNDNASFSLQTMQNMHVASISPVILLSVNWNSQFYLHILNIYLHAHLSYNYLLCHSY